ncbi:MAG: endonuclease/exonuclease/phosphatase family protein [Firmicutes bacterium]|nr:endonuclease/exonuclease/phosphatase family protein [Bacillota bacterium]
MRKSLKIVLCCLLALVLLIASYVAYVFITYYRIEDKLSLTPENTTLTVGLAVPQGQKLKITSWNMGFGAYTDEYSFFMDGGKYSRGFSEKIVRDTVIAIAGKLKAQDSDFLLVQEVDIDSTRSYHMDQKAILQEALPDKSATFALNYDSPYLFWPLIKPHGKSVAGLLTMSDYPIASALRRSLPIQEDFAKLIDLDRCYTVNRIPVDNGKELVLYNFHLSAYTTDPTIADQQLDMLYADMMAEYKAGNYVIAGGDFNKDLLGDSAAIFGVSGEDYSWAQPLKAELIPDGISLIAPFDAANPIPSCRNADAPWNPDTNFQLTIDGFLISDNVDVISSAVIDTQFAWSDHNPVELEFQLK